jgi:hypothetical protein
MTFPKYVFTTKGSWFLCFICCHLAAAIARTCWLKSVAGCLLQLNAVQLKWTLVIVFYTFFLGQNVILPWNINLKPVLITQEEDLSHLLSKLKAVLLSVIQVESKFQRLYLRSFWSYSSRWTQRQHSSKTPDTGSTRWRPPYWNPL